MTVARLREEIAIELALMESTMSELLALKDDLAGREPTVREKTAAGAFLAQLYSGVENILKRISRYYDVSLPVSETWHIALFESYCIPPHRPLPGLFDDDLAARLAPYRNFRHVIYHSYGFDLDWKRMVEGVAQAPMVFQRFRDSIMKFLQELG